MFAGHHCILFVPRFEGYAAGKMMSFDESGGRACLRTMAWVWKPTAKDMVQLERMAPAVTRINSPKLLA